MPPVRREHQGHATLQSAHQHRPFPVYTPRLVQILNGEIHSCANYMRTHPEAERCTCAGPTPARPIYIDLTHDENVPVECAAYCPTCPGARHLMEPFNRQLAQCPRCFMDYRTRLYPCTCPPRPPTPQCDEDRDDGFADLRAQLNDHRPPLSAFAKRTMLLVAQVPPGRYTTYIALAAFYREKWGMMSRTAFGGALKKNEWWPLVPDHRVVASNGGVGRGSDYGCHGASAEDRVETLRGEGVRFDVNGKLLGGSFSDFR